MSHYDVAVIGSGFAGSLFAMIARRQGRSVVLIEKGKHPRFAIGESSTPLSNLLLEELAFRYDLPGIAPLAKWGSWQKSYPQLDCGLKRGFTFYHHQFGRHLNREDQLLVAASPHDRIADTHWHRAPVDEHFLHEAQRIGVDYVDQVNLRDVSEQSESIKLDGITARFVVDATGPRGFLHGALSLPELPLPDFPATQALFTHFRGVGRMPAEADEPPYPVDDAAVHHVFDGGWIWILRFRSGITSAGVAMEQDLAERINLSEGAPAWERLMEMLPTVREQFADATVERSFIYTPRLAFRSGVIVGKRWAMLPSAAGFVDPLLSTGFPLTLLGVTRLAAIMNENWDAELLSTYATETSEELLATARLIGTLYASMENFPLFVSLSLLYFAAASFSETARRLERPHLAKSFLLHDHPDFGALLPAIFERARLVRDQGGTRKLNEEIIRLIEPFNVAGLGRPERRNWYPVEALDLFEAAPKLGADHTAIQSLLDRCGF
ncbi:MAG: FAD-dependent oxidoreductase [Terriglobia bacterium]